MLWLVIALLGVFLIVAVWKKGKLKESPYKSIFYLGVAFTAIGLFEQLRYHEWGLLPLGLVFLLAGWVNRKKWHKSKNNH